MWYLQVFREPYKTPDDRTQLTNLRLSTESRFRCLEVESARNILRMFELIRFLATKKERRRRLSQEGRESA